MSNDMKNLFEVIMQAAKELEHKKLLKFLEDNANEATDNVFDLAADLYTEQSNSHKQVVSGKTNDDKIWQWVQWINKRCAFTEHQQDYIFFAVRQILKKEACASGAGDKTVSVDCYCKQLTGYEGECNCSNGIPIPE